MPAPLRLLAPLALALLAVAPATGQQIDLGGHDSALFVFPADSVLVSVQGEDEAVVRIRFGAAGRGIDLRVGDRITAMNGTAVATAHDLAEMYGALAEGADVRLAIERDETELEVAFAKPARPEDGQIAIAPTPEQLAAARAASGWAGTPLAKADDAAQWTPTPGATATHNPRNGTILFAGDGPAAALRFAPAEPVDLHRHDGLRVRFKGDGGAYALRLTDAAGTTVTLPFETADGRWAYRDLPLDAAALDLDAIAAIEVVPQAAPFRLELDAVEPY